MTQSRMHSIQRSLGCILVLVAVALTGCGKSDSGETAGMPITVKGMRLGMNTNEMLAATQDSLAGYSVEWKPKSKSLYWDGSAPDGSFTMDNWIVAEFDAAGRAKTIVFSPMASSRVFNAANMTYIQFAKEFMRSYGISKMTDGANYAECVTKDGTAVRISPRKEVAIFKATEGEEKPKFD